LQSVATTDFVSTRPELGPTETVDVIAEHLCNKCKRAGCVCLKYAVCFGTGYVAASLYGVMPWADRKDCEDAWRTTTGRTTNGYSTDSTTNWDYISKMSDRSDYMPNYPSRF
jgi:hypothetical protein